MNLVIPLKRLAVAKTRLSGLAPGPDGDRAALVLAMALDTVAAAVATPGVDRVLVAAAAPGELGALAELGAEVVGDGGVPDLNGSLRHVAGVLAAEDPSCVVGALQADLPALRPAELAAVLAAAQGRRSFCADRAGTGTTLLLAAPGEPLAPQFGPQSARAHAASGAVPVIDPVPTLRCDVDTPQDLAHVRSLGLRRHTRAALAARAQAC